MQGMLIIHQEDVAHMSALLSKFRDWGQVRYYDMDAFFEGVEDLTARMFMLFPEPLMDWKTFASWLDDLRHLAENPMRNVHAFVLAVFDERGTRFLDYIQFQAEVARHGHP